MTGTSEMIVAYTILSFILAYYVNHLRSRIRMPGHLSLR